MLLRHVLRFKRKAQRVPGEVSLTSTWGDRLAGVTFSDVGKVYPDGTRAVTTWISRSATASSWSSSAPPAAARRRRCAWSPASRTISDGTIKIGDRVVNHVPPRDRDIAMVFQSYALYPHLTVDENIAFGLRLRRHAEGRDRQARPRTRPHPRLKEFLDRKPRALSGGQRQRVAMGRAIVREPQAFLMDEPLSNLDAKLRVHMRAEIASLQPARRDDDLRHARPGRGDDDGRPGRGHAQGRAPAGRAAAGALRAPGEPLRRRLHRLAGDEHGRGGVERIDGTLVATVGSQSLTLGDEVLEARGGPSSYVSQSRSSSASPRKTWRTPPWRRRKIPEDRHIEGVLVLRRASQLRDHRALRGKHSNQR